MRKRPSGIPITTRCLRHTHAALRLSAGGDAYILASQMGTSVKRIGQHFGHVNTIEHSDRVIMGITGWDGVHVEMGADYGVR